MTYMYRAIEHTVMFKVYQFHNVSIISVAINTVDVLSLLSMISLLTCDLYPCPC